jgi:hypothetical protein
MADVNRSDHRDVSDSERQSDELADEIAELRFRVEGSCGHEEISQPERRRQQVPFCVERRGVGGPTGEDA